MTRALCLVALVGLGGCAHRAPAKTVTTIDIGIVDLQRALRGVRDGQEARHRLLELKRAGHSMQSLLASEQQELKAIFTKMDPVIVRIAAAHGFRAVLERTDSGVLFVAPELDLTDQLISGYEGGPTDGPAHAGISTGVDWFDEKRGTKPGGAAITFEKIRSGLVYVAGKASEWQPPAAAVPIAVVRLEALGLTPSGVSPALAAVARVAAARGLVLVLRADKVAGFNAPVIDVTDDVKKELGSSPSAPVTM
jgi:Skp family chaperone for outer membrane proteins